jgi:acyl-CoA synthetase (AMP-forming)/AMP-acid ligase II
VERSKAKTKRRRQSDPHTQIGDESLEINTLIEMLEVRAQDSGEKIAFTFEDQPTSFQSLWQSINQFASYLLDQDLRSKERVVIALPNGAEFFFAFYGVQRAGGIAVPLFPDSSAERIASIAKSCEARFVVLPEGSLKQSELEANGLLVLEFRNLLLHFQQQAVGLQNYPQVQPDDIAFLQYTSGSTGNPKGVMLTHANLLTNMHQMIAGMQITKEDIFISWLPVYHDMGLILMTMVPFYLAADAHLLAADLRSVRDWLKTIHASRGTFTAAPDFAYRLCLRHLDSLREYDLSSLRVALNAAEPVRAATIMEFESAFGLVNVMVAGYGLAEATVGVSMWTPQTPARVDANGLVSVGHPFPDVELKILKDDPSSQIGEIVIKSAANSKGYFNNPTETNVLFWKNGYIHSGDLGYLDEDGYLYIVGRRKNIIKHAGETIAPQEIEETVDAISGVRMSAAVGIDRGRVEGEQAYVFVEVREKPNILEWGFELTVEIVQAIHDRLGLRPARVVLVKPHTIPKTHNGKIQYVRLRESYLDGTLRKQEKILYPEY